MARQIDSTPELLAMLVDEDLQDFDAAVELRLGEKTRWPTGIGGCAVRTSRSSSLMRWTSSVETPSRWPSSISCWRTQACSVCGTQPILLEMDSMAAHCDGCS